MDAAVAPGESSDKRASESMGWGEGPSDGKLLPPPMCCCGLVWAGEGNILTAGEPCWPWEDHSEDCEIGVT